jgi:hypothetical protein
LRSSAAYPAHGVDWLLVSVCDDPVGWVTILVGEEPPLLTRMMIVAATASRMIITAVVKPTVRRVDPGAAGRLDWGGALQPMTGRGEGGPTGSGVDAEASWVGDTEEGDGGPGSDPRAGAGVTGRPAAVMCWDMSAGAAAELAGASGAPQVRQK